jgi:hypothetical protein
MSRALASLALSSLAGLAGLATATAAGAQARGAGMREVVDAVVQGERLVSVERTPCTAAQESFGAAQCASLVARDVATDAERWRAALPFPLRGLLQIDEASTDAGAGLFVRAHDRGALFDPTGALVRTLDVPTSTLPRPVAFEEARGAFVLRDGDRCSAVVASRSDPTVRVLLRGVESHVYPHGGGPHDTVCFGFEARPVGEVRVGTRPAGRGPRGELRHGISALVVVAARALEHPAAVGPPTLLGIGAQGIVWQRPVGTDDAMLDEVRMTGTGSGARCAAIVREGDRRTEVTVSCTDGRELARSPAPASAASSGSAQRFEPPSR